MIVALLALVGIKLFELCHVVHHLFDHYLGIQLRDGERGMPQHLADRLDGDAVR